MEDPRPAPSAPASAIPEAISFRQLSALLEHAAADGATAAPAAADGQLEQLERLLEAYAGLSRSVLQQLERQGERLKVERSGQQLMALGALGAHIRLGLQALAASRA